MSKNKPRSQKRVNGGFRQPENQIGFPNFPDPDPIDGAQLPTRILNMLGVYGPGPDGRRCVHCGNLLRHKHSGAVYFKCALQVNTCGEGTDWQKRWPACGKFKDRVAENDN